MNKFNRDFTRQSKSIGIRRFLAIIRHRDILALWLCRNAENHRGAIRHCCLKMAYWLFSKKNLEVGPTDTIGGGFLMIHPMNITINHRGSIGEDFTIFKGATIGSIRSGKKRGVPTSGNRVTVCANAMVCGKITIGDDVLIAANAYVNFDVPSSSVVIGNPGVIYHKENPSADYLK